MPLLKLILPFFSRMKSAEEDVCVVEGVVWLVLLLKLNLPSSSRLKPVEGDVSVGRINFRSDLRGWVCLRASCYGSKQQKSSHHHHCYFHNRLSCIQKSGQPVKTRKCSFAIFCLLLPVIPDTFYLPGNRAQLARLIVRVSQGSRRQEYPCFHSLSEWLPFR